MGDTYPSAGVFDEMGIYWAEISDRHSTISQVNFLKAVLKMEGLILDLCCGTARHSILLSKEGYRMVGLDISATLLRIAKEKATEAHVDLPLVRSDMRHLPFKPKVFSAVTSMDTSFGYLGSEREDMQSIAEIARTLTAGGLFLIDVFNREQLIRNYRRKQNRHLRNASMRLQKATFSIVHSHLASFFFRLFRWKEYPSFYMLQNRTLDNEGNFAQDSWIIYDKRTKKIRFFCHAVRLYSFERFQSLLEKVDFQIKWVYGIMKCKISTLLPED